MFLIDPMQAARAYPTPETNDQADARALDMLRELAEISMRASRIAIDQIEHDHANPAARDTAAPDPSLALDRAQHAARQAIALEQRVRAGVTVRPDQAPPLGPAARDPRRPHLRDALHDAAKRAEPDRAARTRLCRFIDERLDVELGKDPDGDIPIVEILQIIARKAGLKLDVAKLSDAVLGMKPRPSHPDAVPNHDPENPPGTAPPNIFRTPR